MGILIPSARQQPSAEQGAIRIRRTLTVAFDQVEGSLLQVRQIMQRHGTRHIDAALGKDAKEVQAIYNSLKELIETHRPDASIENLPS